MAEGERGAFPNCLKCRFHRVSWDPGYPHSCSVFGIKSQALPSVEVFRSTGHHCPRFERNPRIRDAGDPRP